MFAILKEVAQIGDVTTYKLRKKNIALGIWKIIMLNTILDGIRDVVFGIVIVLGIRVLILKYKLRKMKK